ncbi:MAG TPA: hypothetical protein VGI22_06495 [Xanthobacteraceae bacterium]
MILPVLVVASLRGGIICIGGWPIDPTLFIIPGNDPASGEATGFPICVHDMLPSADVRFGQQVLTEPFGHPI